MSEFEDLSINIPKNIKPRIIIIGGGFAGLRLAKELDRKPYQIVLLDKHNYHTFQPLLYQVATAGLEPDSIAGPLRALLKKNPKFFFRMVRVTGVDTQRRVVKTKVGELSYDYLVIATGSKTNYFGNQEIEKLAFPLKKITDALDLRSNFLQSLEQAVMTQNPEKQQSLLNFVIVGGGPTGVEVAGTLGEAKIHVLPQDYPELDVSKINIYLVEGMDRLLNGMSDFAGAKALKYLKEKFGVNVILGRFVKSYDGEKVVLDDGMEIMSRTLVWGAGVQGDLINGLPEQSVERTRIVVNRFNQVMGLERIFALGDVAAMKTEKFPRGHPMVAPVAIQQAKLLAKNLRRKEKGLDMIPFEYVNKGAMATIGRNKAVVDLPGGVKFGGLFAWLVWMFVHLMSIVGFRNKLVVLNNWVWNYFTYDRGVRLIIRLFKRNPEWPKEKKQP
jgi:NADH:ubiquinone reductase (H+-translocating)